MLKNNLHYIIYICLMLPAFTGGCGCPVTRDRHLFEPFWNIQTSYNESLFFVQKEVDEPAFARLLFPAEEILHIKSARQDITYKPGIDYQLKGGRIIVLPQGSRIPFMTAADLYLKSGKPNSIPHKVGDANTSLYWSEGHTFHDRQVEITYKHRSRWDGYMPCYAGDKLTRTIFKLQNRKSLKICISGDSISAGYNASGFTGAPPYMPPYPRLIENALEKVYRCRIKVKNFSVAGWRSFDGAKRASEPADEKPDLIIIAYGMNDISQRDAQKYKYNIKHIIGTIKRKNPEAEFILVSTMLGNTQWDKLPEKEFFRYRNALGELIDKEIALADMTSLTSDILRYKSFYDITGNGVNHPNDFGHRLYAQVILSLLIPQDLMKDLQN